MRLLIPGKSYPQRRALLAASETPVITLMDADGVSLSTPTLTPLVGSAALTSSASSGDESLILASVLPAGWYQVGDTSEIVEIVSVDATYLRHYLRDPLLVDLADGIVLTAAEVGYTVQISSTYEGDIVFLGISSALRDTREGYLVNAYEMQNPLDLFAEIPRLRGQQVNRPDILDVPARALRELRGRLWSDAIKLDNCQVPDRCLPFLRAWAKVYLTEQGIDVIGGDTDRMDALEAFNKAVYHEYKNLIGLNIWRTAAGGTTPRQTGWKVTF